MAPSGLVPGLRPQGLFFGGDMHVETYRHEIKNIGFTAQNDVVITFHNDPFDGEIIIPHDQFQELAEQWQEYDK